MEATTETKRRGPKPKGTVITSTDPIQTMTAVELPKNFKVDDHSYGLIKLAQLGIGVDLLGSKTSLQATRGNELHVTIFGIVAKSGKNGRSVLVPWSNIRGTELFT